MIKISFPVAGRGEFCSGGTETRQSGFNDFFYVNSTCRKRGGSNHG